MSLSKENAKVGTMALAGLKRDIDSGASPAWIDSKGAGIFVATTKSAADIWRAVFPQEQAPADRDGMNDMIVLELGYDNLARRDTKVSAWLNSHRAATRLQE